jgi:hypothetical protein
MKKRSLLFLSYLALTAYLLLRLGLPFFHQHENHHSAESGYFNASPDCEFCDLVDVFPAALPESFTYFLALSFCILVYAPTLANVFARKIDEHWLRGPPIQA